MPRREGLPREIVGVVEALGVSSREGTVIAAW
jgi:hypothetical protein